MKQQIEDFVRDLLATRLAEESQILANRIPYRQRFFTSDCQWDSHKGTLEMIKSETIINIEEKDSEALVITEFKVPFLSPNAQTQRRRYHLKVATDRWLIQLVEKECQMCRGRDNKKCLHCKGKGWIAHL